MPCSDSSSSIFFRLDSEERFVKFEFAKITCGREITSQTGLSEYFAGKNPQDILSTSFETVQSDLPQKEEESQFILYMEWDALRSAIAQYLGIEYNEIDADRCRITSINYDDRGVEVAEVILPPKELPKILPCSLGEKSLQPPVTGI